MINPFIYIFNLFRACCCCYFKCHYKSTCCNGEAVMSSSIEIEKEELDRELDVSCFQCVIHKKSSKSIHPNNEK